MLVDGVVVAVKPDKDDAIAIKEDDCARFVEDGNKVEEAKPAVSVGDGGIGTIFGTEAVAVDSAGALPAWVAWTDADVSFTTNVEKIWLVSTEEPS
ncbi:hypothetical protein HDU87_006123 [Geranomyces variabilis]|uniref:Uncharacterized protein n=1 Tax=Geranomyces variabilis TaxID=109894 RepID=A0AAD5TGG9_9FUNG|nr:hypothetical protein HDU87_006123 [Geranomyces variabilis]